MKDNFLKNKDIAIVAYAETRLERRSGKSAFDFACAVATELYEKTGLAPKDIDGLGADRPAVGGRQSVLVELRHRLFRHHAALAADHRHRRLLGDRQRRARGGGDPGRHVRDGDAGRRRRALDHQPRALWRLSRRVLGADRPAGTARHVRAADEPLHRAIRPEVRGARQARGNPARRRRAQPQRLREEPHADHGRGLSQVAPGREPAAAARLGDVLRRRQRADRHDRPSAPARWA